MELICYLHADWAPLVRPAEPTREWMDQTRFSYAYRCLPLNIANSHGWEILCPMDVEAIWDGSNGPDGITITVPADSAPEQRPASLFGEGVVTFHIHGLFRTPPGWNLWVGGSPNRPKDGIYPLAGVVETDWSPYTFTMNWRFTRRNHRVRFAAGEPICFVFPVRRSLLASVRPRFASMASEPELEAHYEAWSKERQTFNQRVAREATPLPRGEQWQKRYYRGRDMTDQPVVPDHLTHLRLAPFAQSADSDATPPDTNAPLQLDTDIDTLGRVIGDIAAAARYGDMQAEDTQRALIQRLASLGLGESEAMEVLWRALDRQDEALA